MIASRTAAVFGLTAFGLMGLMAVAKAWTPSLVTRWSREVSATNVLPEYPRPTMVRADWLNLNGLWDLRIARNAQTNVAVFTSKILVPFPVESRLSGVQRMFTEYQRMWYHRTFRIPPGWKGRRVLLHFGAVDFDCDVSVNGKEVGSHQGGYDRFTFDITDALKPDGEQDLSVTVVDPTDAGFQPRGKQVLDPKQTFYSASSGIWQTVWLEPVPRTFIKSIRLTPNIDDETVSVSVVSGGDTNAVTFEAVAFDKGREVGRAIGGVSERVGIRIPRPKLWSPETPFLYDIEVNLVRNGVRVDGVSSYFGMRKISVAKDESGFPRLMLNDKRVFQLGVLDQGYWPDGIYTPPSDGALRSDIEMVKRLGFNMIRKHVKIEPERWYYWCDKLGLLVWQDMPSGDGTASAKEQEIRRRPESKNEFENELRHWIEQSANHPSIVLWVLFNQGWGQFDTMRLTGLVKELDPTRLVISASGWHDMECGDVRSLHKYPGPAKPELDGKRPCVLGECGGLGLVVTNHLWSTVGFWNTTFHSDSNVLIESYEKLVAQIKEAEEREGLSGAVVTQLTDVETELNGFMTYDRQVLKMPVDRVRAANAQLLNMSPQPAHTSR